MVATRSTAAPHTYMRRSVVLLALFSLLSSLLVVAAPPSQASNGPIPMGPQDAACTTFYFNYIADPHDLDERQSGTAVDYYRYCDEPAQGAGPGDVSRQDTIDHGVEELSAALLHISCSDDFDEPVYEDEGDDTTPIIGFRSSDDSELDGWLVAPRDKNGTPVADFAVERKVGSAGFKDCGNFPVPDEQPDPDEGSVAVTKTVDDEDLTGSDPDFSFTLFADDEGTWVEVSTLDTSDDVEWDELLLGNYLLCETNVPPGYTTEWPDDARFSETTHEDDSCVAFTLETDGELLTIAANNATTIEPVGLSVTKDVEDPDGVWNGEDFEFTLSCADGDGFDETYEFDLGDDETWVFSENTGDELFAGFECDLVEDEDHGAESVAVTFNGDAVDEGESVTLGADGNDFVVTNTFPDDDREPVGLSVTKNVEDPDGVWNGEDFEFTLSCADGDGFDETYEFDLGDDGTWVFSENSGDELFAGFECDLVEDEDHGAESVAVTFNGDAVDEGESVTLGADGNDFVVTNTFEDEVVDPDPVDVTVEKVVDDPDGVLVGDEIFEMTLTCESVDYAIELADGDPAWVFSGETTDEVFAGDTCSLVEDVDHGAAGVTVTFNGDPVAQDAPVTLADGGNDFVVTNTFEDEVVDPEGIIIELVKTNDADGDGTFADAGTAPEEGADVDFRLVVMNTNGVDVVVDSLTDSFGNVTVDLLDGSVTPEGATTLTDNDCADLEGETIPAGESETCTFTLEGYAPPAGEDLTNTAEVEVHQADEPGNRAEDADDSTVTTLVEEVFEGELEPGISLVKEADVTEAEVGDVITYTYTVTNTGDTTLTDITLDDDVLGEITLEATTLEPGESTTGTATHTVTEDDLDANEVYNIAIVTGWPPEGEAVTDEDDETVVVFEQAVEDVVLEPAPAEEELPRTGLDLLALLTLALAAFGLGAGTLRMTPTRTRPTT